MTGSNIYYEVHGSGPALLLTHGYSATAQMWKGQIEPLSKKHQLIIWDMRGHGQIATIRPTSRPTARTARLPTWQRC